MKNLQHQSSAHKWFFWIKVTGTLLFSLYSAAAFYYSTLTPDSVRLALTILFPLLVSGLFFFAPTRITHRAIPVLGTLFVIWYLTDPPRNNRDWAEEYALPADAVLTGRTVHIQHIRNFKYKTETDYTPHYYDATYNLDDLSSVDMITSYWAGESIAHVFLTFGFKDGQHIAISIETRRQKRFPYSVIAGFFHHYEMFYVTADEKDLIGVRTDIRKERVYLYRLFISPQTRERLFKSYLSEIHFLHTHPRWYNTLTDNCTTEILSRAGAQLQYRLDWRVLLSGYTASLAYDLGLLNTQYDFPTLKRLSRIYRPDGATPDDHYSQEIRANLPLDKGVSLPQNK
ncbi:hypothetical protein AZ09_11655 [Acetobacter aceti 1023]|nr:hypothetical protein AZ09_11655 [Acetobacter aceti 1023]